MLLIGLFVGLADAMGGLATPVDALAYWQAGTSTRLYPEAWSDIATGYLFYPPPVAQLSALLQPIGWSVFIVGIMVATFGAFWYCARKWSLPLLAIGVPYFLGVGPIAPATFLSYALLGNLQWILAALTVLALRGPVLYAPLVVTKLAVGVGWWWHVFRREWRLAAIGAAATLTVFAISFMAGPELWIDFMAFVQRNLSLSNPPLPTFPVPFWIRVPMSIGLVAWGSRTDRPWTVPVAAGWALPALYGPGFLPFWVAAFRLRR